jgi:hypothetical protein
MVAAAFCVLNVIPAFSEELIGDENSPTSVANTTDFKGVKKGSILITPGILYASSLVGGEVEFGLAKFISLMFGAGFIGADGGVVFHVLNKNHINLTINCLGDFMPALQSVLPEVSFGVRGFFGRSARVGVGGRIGIAIITNTISVSGIHYTAGAPMLTYCIGVPIRVKY